MSKDIQELSSQLSTIKSTGHVVMAGQGAVVAIDSTISNSFNDTKARDPVLADAIQTISGFIERSGNKEAGAIWARFLKELSGERDKAVLSAFWDRVVKILPDVATLAESTAKITALFCQQRAETAAAA